VLSFLAGNNNDSVSVLALSTATTIAIVRYAMPAWRNRRFIENRWLAWTGNSRTAIRAQYTKLDQQSMFVNRYMSGRPISPKPRPKATATQLHTLYRASYTSMVISLNYFAPGGTTKTTRTNTGIPIRPDLLCFALLWLADHAVELDPATGRYRRGQGVSAPEWWGEDWVKNRLADLGSLVLGCWG
jgi:hypothetical protein